VLTGVPPLATATPDARQRFVLLVDVLHDRGAELTLVSEHPLGTLLEVAQPPPGLARTASRLRLLRGCALADSGA
jgi:predicted ATPase